MNSLLLDLPGMKERGNGSLPSFHISYRSFSFVEGSTQDEATDLLERM